MLSSSRGQGNFWGLEASRPRAWKCVLEAKDVLEDSTSAVCSLTIINESNLDFLNCLSLFSVSDFRNPKNFTFLKIVDMRSLCFLVVYVILTKQTSSQTTSCSSNIGSGSDSSTFDSNLEKAMQACIRNIDQCAKKRFAFPSSTPTPQIMMSDSTKPMMSQTMSKPSKGNDEK